MESYRVKFAFNNSVYFGHSKIITILKLYAKIVVSNPQDIDMHILCSLYVVTCV
jgi:hypothetical protein